MKSRLIDLLYRSKLPHLAYDLNKIVALPLSSRFDLGTNPYDEDWDMLVVLDTCRPDALREVADEYDFLSAIPSVWSVGSATPEWVANTFTTEHIDDVNGTAYVASHGGCQWIFEQDKVSIYDTASSNILPLDIVEPLTEWDTVDRDDFLLFDLTWKYRADNEYAGTTLPLTVTDRAIAVGREVDFDRFVVHYKQPHAPYVANAIEEDRDLEPHEETPWEYLRDGGSRERVWESYLDELRWGLDNVATLLENVDAERTIITADHGDAFGEYGIYSHPLGIFHPSVRKVPWAETTATDSGSYEPEVEPASETDGSLQEQLDHLGYLS